MEAGKDQKGNFKCLWCRSTEKMLTVHHLYYLKGKDPWDYPDEALITLCEECHKEAEDLRVEILSHLRSRNSQRAILLLAKALDGPDALPGIVPGAFHAANDFPDWLESALELVKDPDDLPRHTLFADNTLHIIDMIMQAKREADDICSR